MSEETNDTRKTLLGLAFRKEEPKWVRGRIRELLPSVVGVQIGENYEEREQKGIYPRHIIQIVRYLRGRGIEIVPLQDEELLQKNMPLVYAKNVLEGYPREKLEEELAYKEVWLAKYDDPDNPTRDFMDPSGAYEDRYYIEIFRSALEILDRVTTLDDFMKLWDESNTRLQAGMLERINAKEPQLVVMGAGHADKLKNQLPDYEYVKSPFVEAGKKGE
jgi:hypothetical protein